MDASTEVTPRELIARIVAENRAFEAVPRSTLEAFVAGAAMLRARKGQTIYRPGEDWERLGFVVSGSIGMLASAGGERKHLYERISAGHFFGVAAVFDGEPEMADTEVLSPEAVYAWIPRAAAIDLCRTDATFSFALATVIARRLRTATALLADQLNLSTRERLARFLLDFAHGPGMQSAAEPLPSMTQTQIAAAAGTVKEVVARLIAEFEAAQALRRERGHVRYLNRQKLIRMATTVVESTLASRPRPSRPKRDR